jgi:hypothetical protein
MSLVQPVVVLVVFLIGCRAADGNRSRSETVYKLQCLGEITQKLSEKSVDYSHLKSLDGLLAAAVQNQVISEVDYENRYFATDGWGREFHYEKTSGPEGTTLRIGSRGGEGVLDKGKGNDIYLEMLLDNEGHIRVIHEPGKQ